MDASVSGWKILVNQNDQGISARYALVDLKWLVFFGPEFFDEPVWSVLTQFFWPVILSFIEYDHFEPSISHFNLTSVTLDHDFFK